MKFPEGFLWLLANQTLGLVCLLDQEIKDLLGTPITNNVQTVLGAATRHRSQYAQVGLLDTQMHFGKVCMHVIQQFDNQLINK